MLISSIGCSGFNVEGSTQGSWSDTYVGSTVKITCQRKYVLAGNSELTCKTGGSWSSNVPKCKKLGNVKAKPLVSSGLHSFII